MQFKNILIAAAAGTALAQTNSSQSLCDKYTTALLGTNNATTQLAVLTLLVNTVVIGNYSAAGTMNAVPGILANGTVDGETVSLLKYFDGSLVSTNRQNKAVAVNFLDGGGAAPLMENKAANDTSSNQYFLLTHLYQFFGTLLGCSGIGQMGFEAYGGEPSMYKVHKFMALSAAENKYFIQQVGLAATSFGVTTADATAVGELLTKTFNYRCAPAAPLTTGAQATLNSICLDRSCPVAEQPNCAAYDTANNNGTSPEPVAASSSTNGTSGGSGSGSGTSTGGSGSGTGTATGTGSSGTSTTTPNNAAVLKAGASVGLAAFVAAVFAM